jgi:hypothetical protein
VCNRGSQTFPEVNFTLAYQLAGHEIINWDDLLKLHGTLLKMFVTYCYKQVHIPHNNTLFQNHSLALISLEMCAAVASKTCFQSTEKYFAPYKLTW